MSNLQADIPLVNVPFVDDKGNVSEVWFIFLVQLWRRTGGGSPPTGILTIKDVIGLEQTFATHAEAKDSTGAFDTTFAPIQAANRVMDVVVSQPQAFANVMEMVTAPALDLGGTNFGIAMTLWFKSLPTTLPATSGVLWNNGGTLALS